MTDLADVRHGVFLLPDARTSATVTQITTCLRAQFGIVSAGRFPPHVTLAGSLALSVAEGDLLAAVREVASRHVAFSVSNAGVKQLWGSVLAFDVHEDATGRPNRDLLNLAVDVMDAARPLLRATQHLPADLHDRDSWHGHMSLASHEVSDRPDLLEKLDQFVRDLDEPFPQRFDARRLGVFRLHHPDWSGQWWTDFWWELVDLLDLGATPLP